MSADTPDVRLTADAAEAKIAAVEPCPTCVREGGPYRCCPCCADDPYAHEGGQSDHHDLPCSICVRAALGGEATP